jgi:hypothetical protein
MIQLIIALLRFAFDRMGGKIWLGVVCALCLTAAYLLQDTVFHLQEHISFWEFVTALTVIAGIPTGARVYEKHRRGEYTKPPLNGV